jgi:hypothetical protein
MSKTQFKNPAIFEMVDEWAKKEGLEFIASEIDEAEWGNEFILIYLFFKTSTEVYYIKAMNVELSNMTLFTIPLYEREGYFESIMALLLSEPATDISIPDDGMNEDFPDGY